MHLEMFAAQGFPPALSCGPPAPFHRQPNPDWLQRRRRYPGTMRNWPANPRSRPPSRSCPIPNVHLRDDLNEKPGGLDFVLRFLSPTNRSEPLSLKLSLRIQTLADAHRVATPTNTKKHNLNLRVEPHINKSFHFIGEPISRRFEADPFRSVGVGGLNPYPVPSILSFLVLPQGCQGAACDRGARPQPPDRGPRRPPPGGCHPRPRPDTHLRGGAGLEIPRLLDVFKHSPK